MTEFTTGITARLSASAPVAALAGARHHWGTVPQSTALPYVRLSVISDPRPRHLDGEIDARESRFQADCFAKTYTAARALALAVQATFAEPGDAGGIRFNCAASSGPVDRGGEMEGVGFVHMASIDLQVEHTKL